MTRRLFVAAWLSPGARREAEGVLVRLGAAKSDVRWVPVENLHVTLRFLGDVEERRIDELQACLARGLEGESCFGLRLEGLGRFPPRGHPRVVWIGVGEGARELASVASVVERVLLGRGFLAGIDSRPFRAHVTLGRPRSARGIGRLLDLLGEMSFTGDTHPLEKVTLAESRLSPRGATYQALARFPLGGEGRASQHGGRDR